MLIYLCIFFMSGCLYIYVRNKKISIKISEKLLRRIIVLISVTNLIAIGIELRTWVGHSNDGVRQIERETYGGLEKREIYKVQVDEMGEETIEIEISPRMYDSEQLEQLFSEAKESLDKIILGDNISYEIITRDIVLPSTLSEYPFTINWELSRYDVINLSGQLNKEEIIRNDPENQGVEVKVTGTLLYEDKKELYQAEIRVFAADDEMSMKDSIQALIEKEDEKSREEKYLILPDSWNGKKLTWEREQTDTASYVLLLGVVISILLVFNEKQKKEEERKIRNEEMLLDYPEIISQFTMLLGAGMTTKNVWKKMAEDYKWQKSCSGKKREAYEEILYTWQEMQSGIPEAECYERFGRRCEILPYLKMGALLSQNLRKGSRGITQMLRMEAVEAMEERKNRAKRLGEEAGTKLLIPMVIMLVVVLAIVVVPAFWSTSM